MSALNQSGVFVGSFSPSHSERPQAITVFSVVSNGEILSRGKTVVLKANFKLLKDFKPMAANICNKAPISVRSGGTPFARGLPPIGNRRLLQPVFVFDRTAVLDILNKTYLRPHVSVDDIVLELVIQCMEWTCAVSVCDRR